ncbi:hypothetical protein JTE90_011692 [Oedothorax gibbosus]|uniref:Uncharacterized protein n=1 Tax=Oedothorax gibbosus TaxID=931172 RepID=A0AAV6UU33_9ARAC|nr:hypothetical protein JTE90_011692 [Oedothorax gibbosus]
MSTNQLSKDSVVNASTRLMTLIYAGCLPTKAITTMCTLVEPLSRLVPIQQFMESFTKRRSADELDKDLDGGSPTSVRRRPSPL